MSQEHSATQPLMSHESKQRAGSTFAAVHASKDASQDIALTEDKWCKAARPLSKHFMWIYPFADHIRLIIMSQCVMELEVQGAQIKIPPDWSGEKIKSAATILQG